MPATPEPREPEESIATEQAPPGPDPPGIKRKLLDAALGIALPIVCFVCDPIVFNADGLGTSDSSRYSVLAKSSAGLSMIALGIWLVIGRQRALLAGAMGAGAMIAIALGLALAPLSLIGLLFFGIGLLGFSPFLVGWIYWRNARSAFKIAAAGNRGTLVVTAIIGFLLVLAPPIAAHRAVTRELDQGVARALSGDPGERAVGFKSLRKLRAEFGISSHGEFYDAYQRAKTPEEARRIFGIYRELWDEELFF